MYQISFHKLEKINHLFAENKHDRLQLKEFFRKTCVSKGMLIIEVPLSYSGIGYLSTSTLFDLQPIS